MAMAATVPIRSDNDSQRQRFTNIDEMGREGLSPPLSSLSVGRASTSWCEGPPVAGEVDGSRYGVSAQPLHSGANHSVKPAPSSLEVTVTEVPVSFWMA